MTSFFFHNQFHKKILQFLFWGAFLFLLFPKSYPQPHENKPLLIFANQCDDDIRSCFIKALKSAQKTILLHIYSLNDEELCKILEKKKSQGLDIKIIIDAKNAKDIKKLGRIVIPKEKKSGLMHQKILVIDEEKVWIGSANFTTSSLRTHDNIVVALHSKEMAQSIQCGHGGSYLIGDQKIELYLLPEEKKIAFNRLCDLLDQTKTRLEIAMFTWTHPLLTEKIIQLNQRVPVRAILDETSSLGTSKKTFHALKENNVFVKTNKGSPMLHHKLAYLDQSILILGSTNWTKAAFSKNDECILIVHDLNKKQQKKLDRLCHAIRAMAQFP